MRLPLLRVLSRAQKAPAEGQKTSSKRSRLRAAAATIALSTTALTATSVATMAPAANAMTPSQIRQYKIDRVMTWASHQRGKPYRYGAAGPSAFDCSGLVMYVFRHAINKSLSHNAEAQYRRSHHITRAHLRRGDLVFQVSGGYAYHVGIYAGHGYMWDAPHSGARVHKHKMYHSHWRYGRLIRR